MRIHSVGCAAPPERVWELMARPGRWREWSPYVRGAEGLGEPEVVEGARGRLITIGGARIAATITAVTPGESWSWRVGGVVIHHSVSPAPGGSRIEHAVEGSSRPWSLAAFSYAPIVALIGRHLARVAERADA